MTSTETTAVPPHPKLLPPRGMVLALILQVPLAVRGWPWHPSRALVIGGGLLLAVGSALNLWSSRQFTRHQVGICPFSAVPRLIEDGAYRLTRNPMYLGMVLIVAAAGLVTGCPGNLWTALGFALWLHFSFVLPEERFLLGLFGEAFTAYVKGRGRWLGWS